jgi:transposase
MLSKYEHLVIFPVHPTTLANYRKSFRPSGAKDDPNDAALLLDVLTLHHDKLRRLQPDTVETRTLQFLVARRKQNVTDVAGGIVVLPANGLGLS